MSLVDETWSFLFKVRTAWTSALWISVWRITILTLVFCYIRGFEPYDIHISRRIANITYISCRRRRLRRTFNFAPPILYPIFTIILFFSHIRWLRWRELKRRYSVALRWRRAKVRSRGRVVRARNPSQNRNAIRRRYEWNSCEWSPRMNTAFPVILVQMNADVHPDNAQILCEEMGGHSFLRVYIYRLRIIMGPRFLFLNQFVSLRLHRSTFIPHIYISNIM